MRDCNPVLKKWIHIKMLVYIFMVPEIINFIDRPNWTKWFRLNRWFNRSDFLVPSLILSQILWKFKPKFHSTTHVVRKMTFWFSILKWKMRKTSIWFKPYHKFCTPFKSSLRVKLQEINQKMKLENVQSRRNIFFSPISNHLI